MYEQIRNLFTSPEETMSDGLWFSGVKGEGLYKEWHKHTNSLFKYCYYTEWIRSGECNIYYENGKLFKQTNYKNDKLDGEFKIWDEDGNLTRSAVFKDGREI